MNTNMLGEDVHILNIESSKIANIFYLEFTNDLNLENK